LKKVGVYLKNPCWSHGQLYVAFSRVSDPNDITLYLDQEEKQHGVQYGSFYTNNCCHRSLLQDEILKFKESPDYGEGPEEFRDGKQSTTLIIRRLSY